MFHLKLYRHTAVSAALLLAASCSDAPTSAPASLDRIGSIASQQDGSVARGDVLKRTFSFSTDVSRRATISPDGGVLFFPEAGLYLAFPPGAVAQTTVITVTAFQGNRVAYDFQPHGTTFATPIYVAQMLFRTELHAGRSDRKPSNVWAGYLSNGAGDILSDGSASFTEVFTAFFQGKGSDRVAIFTTTHFSGYAMATGVRGTAMLPRDGE